MRINLVIILSVLLIIVLIIIERKFKKKLQIQEKDRNIIYLQKIEDLKKLDKNYKIYLNSKAEEKKEESRGWF